MSNVTVDPEMKSRIMSAVSQAIKDQSAAPDDTDGDKANVTDLTNKFVDTRANMRNDSSVAFDASPFTVELRDIICSPKASYSNAENPSTHIA